MSFYDENKTMEVCPYNKAHVVRRSKMPMHIQKCERLAPKKLPRCSFNSCHVLQVKDVARHEANCPDRMLFDKFFTQTDQNSIAAKVAAASRQAEEAPMPEVEYMESWDHFSFNSDQPVLNVVQKNAKTRDVFLNVPSAPPAERKQHVIQERERRINLKAKSLAQED